MRIGDILRTDGVITAGDLDAALSEQLVTRSSDASAPRLGSILYQRGLVPADVIARALARQHAVPAALGRHLEQRDPLLAARVPAELARRFVALPVAQTRSDDAFALIVCMRDPTDPAAIELISRAARMPIVAAVACEAVLAPLVNEVYAGGDAVEEFDVDMEESGPILSEPIPPIDPLTSGTFQLVGLDEAGVARDETQVAQTTQRPSGRLQIPGLAHDAPTLDGALARIAQTAHRDDVADAAIAYLATRWAAAVVMVVRDGLALGHRGFGGALTPASVEAIVVPLNQPSVLRTAHDRKAPYVGPPTETSVVQDRFLRATGWTAGGEVVVYPVSLRDRVVCLVFARGLQTGHAAETAHAELRTLAQAMEASFLRLIRDSKRPGTQS